MRRQRLAASIATLVALLMALAVAGPAVAARKASLASSDYPRSMSSLGDSITRGFNAAGWFADRPDRSWSTGTNTTVKSHYTRLVALNPRLKGNAHNNARTGAKMRELPGQATTSVSQGAAYVTVLMGANDACTATPKQMTPVADFAASFDTAMKTLSAQSPQPKVLVASIPNLMRLYKVGKNSSSARAAWNAYDICQSMLARPLSTDQADVDRRARVRDRVKAYNAELAEVCGTYTFCKYDGGAVFGYPFTLGQLSGWDYFHPNTSGQAALSQVTYQEGYWPTS